MSTITADPTLLLVLGQMKDVTEIRDADGNVVGVYTPKTLTADDVRKMFDLDKARATYERDKGKGRPFKEILRRLKAIEAQERKKGKGKRAGHKKSRTTVPNRRERVA
jgi:hypothetical protein